MLRFLHRIHERVGDYWWYSMMLFCACRAADVLNAFVGLWLVPKHVDPSELGAVMPLVNFANFFAIPAAAFANTFRNELTQLSIGREYGKLKSLMRGVFVASAVFLFAAIVAARFVLPHFLERIRIVEGSLGTLIIVSSFVGAVAPVYTNALQAMKKFRAQSFLSVVCAPVRLLAMLAAMPFRALSGYFAGQTAGPAFQILTSVVALRKELAVPAKPYWNAGTAKKFSALFAVFAASAAAAGFSVLVESTVIRQRLPDIDSAGYYMAARFAETACYLYSALVFAFFPFAAELAGDPAKRMRLVAKSIAANLAFSALLAAVFVLAGRQIIMLLPHGGEYSAYWWAVPWLTAITGATSIYGFYSTAEIAAERFGFMKWAIPLDLAYPVLMLLVTGYGYFEPYLPETLNAFLAAHNIRSLGAVLVWMTFYNAIKSALCIFAMRRESARRAPPEGKP